MAAGVIEAARNEATLTRPAYGAARMRQARAAAAGRAEYREAAGLRAKHARAFLAAIQAGKAPTWIEGAIHVAASS